MTNAVSGPPPQIPPELLRSVPRQVALSAAGKLVAVIAILCAAGIVADLVGTVGQVRLGMMAREGVPVSAEVLNVTQKRGDHPRQVVHYRYQAVGEWRQGRTTLRERDRRQLESGSRVDIAYLPSRPEVSWIAGYEPGFPLWAVPIIPIALMVTAAFLLRELRRQRELLSNGHAALARVTGTKRIYRDKHHAYRVDYEFQLLSGATRRGHYDVAKNPPAAGSMFTVLYDPDEPQRNKRYPLTLVRTF